MKNGSQKLCFRERKSVYVTLKLAKMPQVIINFSFLNLIHYCFTDPCLVIHKLKNNYKIVKNTSSIKQNNWTTGFTHYEVDCTWETLIWLESVTEKVKCSTWRSLCNDLRNNLLSNHTDDTWLTIVIVFFNWLIIPFFHIVPALLQNSMFQARQIFIVHVFPLV